MRTLSSGQFHGDDRESRRLDGLTLSENEYAPAHRLSLHAHERPFFSLLLRGSYTETLERGRRTLVPTSLVYYPANEPHADAFGEEGGRAFNIELGGRWLARMTEGNAPVPAGSVETRAARVNWLATRLYAAFAAGRATPSVQLEALVLDMLTEVVDIEEPGLERSVPVWLHRVRDLLHARFREVIRVSELADEAGVHPVHLARVFRSVHGCTVGEYVRRLRVEHACAELVRPSSSLSSLALQLGFSDQAHFSRRFKEVTGMPPGAYRKLLA